MPHELIVALGDRTYRVERPFGSWPTNTGFVTDVTVDPRGHVFVMLRHDPLVHPADARVIELDPVGRYIAGWGGEAIADSHMLTATPSGHLIAVDRDMHEVIWFTASGERVGQLGVRGRPNSPFNHPTDVAVAPWGDIYVSDGYGAPHVHRFASDGRHVQTWGGHGSGDGEFVWPHSIWAFADGRVVVIDRTWNRVQVFDGEGRWLDTWYDFYQPVGIWGDVEGNAYITDMVPSLTKVAPDGTRIGRCRPMLNGAHGLCGTPSGDILLAEGNPSRITRLKLVG
ncbi:peptidase [Phreatobacter oligotrophus]|uniref:Peptidylglycine monooxygenase n=1 Tax=Phreatobacter oligotrophus TaxID=1122261 RepID=A0A2T4YYR0_9HYPH|nr:peptidase [Phreatobacter oligotrophus]PTM51849.1 peptidylglycine monooxygenase [Phreatobacter oligotrophus]